nr:hypothetical protein [Micromonospora sp. DSM 115978]
MDEKVKTFCRNCSALCSMEVTVRHGRITGVTPDGSVSPYGPYICPKGQASIEFHDGAEGRLRHSLARRADGE